MTGISEASVTAIIARSIDRIVQMLEWSVAPGAATPLGQVFSERWLPVLRSIQEKSREAPTVAIGIVGATGAGKSTLLNAILGTRILPVGNSRACTAAVSEVSFAPGTFSAQIEFVSRECWKQDIERLLADIQDEAINSDEVEPRDHDESVSKAARDRLKAVYGIKDEAIQPGLRFEQLVESPDIQNALDKGTITVTVNTVGELRDELKNYLDSKYRFWPLVKAARISGPFPGMTVPGVRLVDLPGVGDASDARVDVTSQFLKQCRFVWLVFDVKRALLRDIWAIMQKESFVRQIVMDGRDTALTFVGTTADQFDREAAIEEYNLNEDETNPNIVAARNNDVRTVLSEQLRDIAHGLASHSHDPARAEELAARLQRSKVFTVSARDYLHLQGISKNTFAILEDTSQTEIPKLREYLATISAAYTPEAHAASLRRQLENLISEIRHHVHVEQKRLAQSNALSEKKRKEIGDALKRLLTFLRSHLDDHSHRFRQEMNSKHELLEERLKTAFERGRNELDHVTEGWKRIHWSTLCAIVRRDGRYNSPTSGQYDFAEDISRPVLQSITFTWTDFFGDKMNHALEVWSDRLVTLADKHRVDTLRDVMEHGGPDADQLAVDLENSLGVTARLMKEYLGQGKAHMSGQLEEVRSSLYGQIPAQVQANMKAAYTTAGNESGRGTKQRIIDCLANHSRAVCKVMFDDARDKIMGGVRMITDSLSGQYKTMTDSVYERLKLPTSNFSDAEPRPRNEIVALTNSLSQLTAQLENFTMSDGLEA